MTFIIGLTCCDGIVLCTDSLEDNQTTKKTVDKIKTWGTSQWGIAVAGAGPARTIDKFSREVCARLPAGKYDQNSIETAIEGVLAEFDSKYVKNVDDEFAVIIAVYSHPGFHRLLYEGRGRVLSPFVEEGHIGVGGQLWRLVADNLYNRQNCVEDNVRLAIFATRLAAKYASGVDEPVRLISYKFGDQHWKGYLPAEISAIEAQLPLEGFRGALKDYWNIHNPPTRLEQGRVYGIVRTPGDELTFLEGVKLEELQTVSGRTRALRIFDRNRDRIGKRARLEWERTSGQKGN